VVRFDRDVATRAGPDAVILADVGRSWSLPTFGPRVVALLHRNPLVVDYQARLRDVSAALSGGTPDATRTAIIEKYAVTHVLVANRSPVAVRRYLEKVGTRSSLPEGYDLYALHPAARIQAP
jgi:hypothetical protein